MPLICYQPKKFDASTLAVIDRANTILDDYASQGYDLTLRQLYYQFVSKGLIPNKDAEYKRLGSIVNDARLAGLIDWARITDRTRNLRQNSHWDSPAAIVATAAFQYQVDKWADQPNYVECWVEKDALVGVLQVACQPLDVPYFSCRGYTSQSEVWVASQRLLAQIRAGKRVTIIHLGDHDPSGIDMSRDILDRLTMFLRHHRAIDTVKENPRGVETRDEWADRLSDLSLKDPQYTQPVTINRIALNMDQVDQYNPPPNPAKLTDSRCKGYIAQYGDSSWELDALEPSVITSLIQDTVFELRDLDKWEESTRREDLEKQDLKQVAGAWNEAVAATRP
jgi:hypothetical protein